MLAAGTVINRTYELERLLGKGGMGEVWQARHLLLDEARAIKIILADMASDQAIRRRFIKGEASASLRLEHHPNIVRVYELGQHENIPYIVMEFVPGGPEGATLLDLLERQTRLPLAVAGEMLEQVAAGLEVAHRHGLVHRDIKPANILVTATPAGAVRYKISDFGLIKDLQTDVRMTATGFSVGTAAYMSPEQAEGTSESRSDIYGLGVVMYETLTGQLPFKGLPIMQLAQHINNPPPPMSSFVGDIPAAIESVILKALAKKPSDRYATSTEFAAAYRQVLSNSSGAAYHVTEIAHNVQAGNVPPVNLPTAQVGPTNLPHPVNRLVGRDSVTADLRQLLQQPDTHLVTLTGPGGTGKTRLALHVASELRAFFQDGVFLVNLAALSDPALVLPAITQTLNLREGDDQSPLVQLRNHLARKQILLVLDNFEQVIRAAADISALVNTGSKSKILVTSQTALRVYGEQEKVVAPLAQVGAIALFVDRARTVKPDFTLDAETAPVVAEICTRLDGLPLAIELAAARSRLLTPPAILARLTSRLDLLVGGARNLEPRQQTMRGALDWSYDLLSAEEKQLFARLAVFADSWSFEMAEIICNLDRPIFEVKSTIAPARARLSNPSRQNSRLKLLDLMTSLLDKNMLRQENGIGREAEPRLKMLQTIHEYAAERLTESDEEGTLRQRHAEYFAKLAEEVEPQLQGGQQAKWLEKLETEHANLRAALEWLLEAGPLDLAARLGGALWVFWEKHGYLGEGRRWLEAISDKYQPDAQDQAALLRRAKVVRGAAVLAHTQGDHARAVQLHSEGLLLLRQAGDKVGIAHALNDMGWEALRRGDYRQATAYAQESLAMGRELADQRAIAAPLFQLGTLTMLQKNYRQSALYFQESLPLWRELGDRQSIAAVLTFLGFGAWLLGDYVTAGGLLRESLAMGRDADDRLGMHVPLVGLAGLAASQGKLPRAARLIGAEEALREAAGAPIQPGFRDLYLKAAAPVKARMQDKAIAAAYAEGRRMELSQAVALALGDE